MADYVVVRDRVELGRLAGLDALRGLAVVLMVGDHLSVLFGNPLYRETLGRLAMPLFFVLAGAFARSAFRWKLAGWGLLLPAVVVWIDRPNVLLWLALLSPVVWFLRRKGWLVPALVVCLGMLANGYGDVPGSYPPPALLGLMLAGALLGRYQLEVWGRRLPARSLPALSFMGRHALGLYVGHVLVLEGVRLWLL